MRFRREVGPGPTRASARRYCRGRIPVNPRAARAPVGRSRPIGGEYPRRRPTAPLAAQSVAPPESATPRFLSLGHGRLGRSRSRRRVAHEQHHAADRTDVDVRGHRRSAAVADDLERAVVHASPLLPARHARPRARDYLPRRTAVTLAPELLAHVPTAALICLDPGHGTIPSVGRQVEPIAPGSHVMKLKDGGGAPGEAPIALAVASRTRALLLARGYRVAMTRTGPTYAGGNIARARFCNKRRAALMLRIHADGSADPSAHGISTLYKRGSRRPAELVQRAVVQATGARDDGVVLRTDLTGFNWATVPAILVETGFMTNARERRLLQSRAYQERLARGLVAGVEAFVAP